jgi:ribosome maturation factor RimP
LGSAGKAGFFARFFFRKVDGERRRSMDREIVERVESLANPILRDEEMELVETEYRREARGWVLRLTIDKEGGVTLDDCARVSREVGRILDIEDVISVPYTLEVSSPGLRRPLHREKDFLKYRDRNIRVKTFAPVENRRQFKGRLLGLVDNCIEMAVDDDLFRIPLSNVAKANLEIDQ